MLKKSQQQKAHFDLILALLVLDVNIILISFELYSLLLDLFVLNVFFCAVFTMLDKPKLGLVSWYNLFLMIFLLPLEAAFRLFTL